MDDQSESGLRKTGFVEGGGTPVNKILRDSRRFGAT